MPSEIRFTHSLKTNPEVFQLVVDDKKTFELRRNDRGFECGDILVLRETVWTDEDMKNGRPVEYTGRQLRVVVSHILYGPKWGLDGNWVIMSIKKEIHYAQ